MNRWLLAFGFAEQRTRTFGEQGVLVLDFVRRDPQHLGDPSSSELHAAKGLRSRQRKLEVRGRPDLVFELLLRGQIAVPRRIDRDQAVKVDAEDPRNLLRRVALFMRRVLCDVQQHCPDFEL